MCGRFAVTETVPIIASVFHADEILADLAPSYNIAPTQPVLAVTASGGRRAIVAFRWGLVPHWAKDPSIGSRMINARAETIREKPAFRDPLKSRRCLVVASGFYEWRKGKVGKVPYFIHMPERSCFGFAGLYDRWRSPAGEELATCTIITTAANERIMPVHDRMPVILTRSGEEAWLDPGMPVDALLLLLKTPQMEGISLYPVSTLVNATSNNSPECLSPVME